MQFHIILVEPARPENVGAAARAMKTMGFTSLRIVNSDAHLQDPARWVAHGSQEILASAQVFPTLAEAVADTEWVIASTARERARFNYYATPREVLAQAHEKQSWMHSAALVFGREESGLTNEELALADLLTCVPMQADYPSLNLGQAVMVYCYQLAEVNGVVPETECPPQAGQLQALRRRMQNLLVQMAVDNDQKLTDWLDQRMGVLAQRDTAMLHTLLNDIEKYCAAKKVL
ncbi:MAG: tRNA/rRNA methyltransferase [Plesiomonas sp.]|uniref:tRNA/rRNA methyltransferase n=1 Tax=Plesiomonas sp. TaxID=2486279 RepID=UPI003EE80FD7